MSAVQPSFKPGDNPYKISNECYQIMQKAMQHKGDALCLTYCQQMEKVAKEKGDMKALALSSFISLKHYDESDLAQMSTAAQKARDVALQTGYLQYYFASYGYQITIYLNASKFSNALYLAEKCRIDAETHKDNYGRYISFRNLADICQMLELTDLASNYNKQALKYITETPSQTPAGVYRFLAEEAKTFDQAMEYMKKSQNSAKSPEQKSLIILTQLDVYHKWNKKDEFIKLYEENEKNTQEKHLGWTKRSILRQKFHYLIFKHHYSEAEKLLADFPIELERVTGELYLAQKRGNYQKAYEAQVWLDSYKDQLRSNLKTGLAQLAAETQNDNLKDTERNTENRLKEQEAVKAKLNAEKLSKEAIQAKKEAEQRKTKLEQTITEAEQAKAAAEQAAIENAHERERVAQQKLKDSIDQTQTEFEIKRQKQKNEEEDIELLKQKKKEGELELSIIQKTKSSHHMMTIMSALSIIIASFLVVAALFAILAFRRKQTEKRLLILNQQLDKAKEEAETASRTKDVFIQDMSHEIRTPLNIVMGFSQLLCHPDIIVSDQEKTEYGEYIRNHVNMLMMLVDDILDISDIETGNYSIIHMKESVNNICRASMSMVQYQIPNGVKMAFTTTLSDSFSIVTDARRVEQVLINFLTNACKHTIQGSITLHVTDQHIPGEVTFSVTDTGIGIPPEQADNIFERFIKLNNFAQGTGLGLNICKNIATKMNGRVWLDTNYQRGARFLFSIPCNQKPSL